MTEIWYISNRSVYNHMIFFFVYGCGVAIVTIDAPYPLCSKLPSPFFLASVLPNIRNNVPHD